jgi:hypothetical protein
MNIQTKPITDITSLYAAVRKAKREFTGQVWWRGQRDYAWPLRPSLFRSPTGYDERSAILRFKQRAFSRHPNLPTTSDLPSWLFLAQHYRLPTRLLDWTESPLIATFFACEQDECHINHSDLIPDADGALFALSPYRLNEVQVGKQGLLMPEDQQCLACLAPAFNENAQESARVIAIRPSEVDVRLMVQISEFTLSGYDVALEDLDKSAQFIIKFRVDQETKVALRGELKRLGIRLSSIFPDLEHLAEEITHVGFNKPKQNQADSEEHGPAETGQSATWSELTTGAVEGDSG